MSITPKILRKHPSHWIVFKCSFKRKTEKRIVTIGLIDEIIADCVAPTYSILNINKSVGRTVTNKPKQIQYQITCTGKELSSCTG